MEKLTFTMENYLEAIYELSSGNTGARVSDISSRLGVTKASVNSAVATLAEKGLVINEKYKEVFLTPAGRALAEFTSQKHNSIRKFLTDVLKVDKSVANRDACAIEHVISSDSISAMQEYLIRNGIAAGDDPKKPNAQIQGSGRKSGGQTRRRAHE